MHIKTKLCLLVVFAYTLSGCMAVHSGLMSSSVALSSGNFWYTKRSVTGTSVAKYFLGTGGLDKESLLIEAKEDLLRKHPLKSNQALANLIVSYKNASYLFMLYHEVTCIVSADVVEFVSVGNVPESVANIGVNENNKKNINKLSREDDTLYNVNMLVHHPGNPYKIGEYHNGGIVIWIESNGEHGLLANIKNVNSYMRWEDAISNCLQIGEGWHLPSKNELRKACVSRKYLPFEMNGAYWSGNDYEQTFAWSINFDNCQEIGHPKSYSNKVIAVRSF